MLKYFGYIELNIYLTNLFYVVFFYVLVLTFLKLISPVFNEVTRKVKILYVALIVFLLDRVTLEHSSQ